MKIRIATRAMYRDEELIGGIRIPWVELDGTRFTDLASAEISIERGSILRSRITFEFLGPVELVYVDSDGNEVETGMVNPSSLPSVLDYASLIEVEEISPEMVEAAQKYDDPLVKDGSGKWKNGWE